MEHHQVIIVGGGPGGSLLACLLAREGMDVTILEKRTMPRRKPCGGGITLKTASLLASVPWQGAVEDTIGKGTVYYHQGTSLRWPDPVCFMVRRERFDHILLQAARDAGAKVLEDTAVSSVASDGVVNTVHASESREFQGELIVGADGAQSVVARGLRRGMKQGLAVVAEVCPGPERLETHRSGLWVDFGAIPAGYGWVFPKGDHLNIGLASFFSRVKGLPAMLDGFTARLGLAGKPVRYRQGFSLPFHYLADRCVTGPSTILLGDAAGFCDPFTGEGIYHSCFSATLAYEAVLTRRQALWRVPEFYQRLVDRYLGREMVLAQRVAWAFYGMTGWAARFLDSRRDLMQELWTYLYTDTYRTLWKAMGRRLLGF